MPNRYVWVSDINLPFLNLREDCELFIWTQWLVSSGWFYFQQLWKHSPLSFLLPRSIYQNTPQTKNAFASVVSPLLYLALKCEEGKVPELLGVYIAYPLDQSQISVATLTTYCPSRESASYRFEQKLHSFLICTEKTLLFVKPIKIELAFQLYNMQLVSANKGQIWKKKKRIVYPLSFRITVKGTVIKYTFLCSWNSLWKLNGEYVLQTHSVSTGRNRFH